MQRARVDFLICRKSPLTPEGCVFFRGAYDILSVEWPGQPQNVVLVAETSIFRDEAALYDEGAARLIADLLSDFGLRPLNTDDVRWRALPAAISMPLSPGARP